MTAVKLLSFDQAFKKAAKYAKRHLLLGNGFRIACERGAGESAGPGRELLLVCGCNPNSIVLMEVTRRAYSPKGFVNQCYGFLKNSHSFGPPLPSLAPSDKSIVSLKKARDCSVLDGGRAGDAVAKLPSNLFGQTLLGEWPCLFADY